MPDDEGGLHDGGELDVAVSFMLTLELVQQGLIGGLRETGGNGRDCYQRWKEKKKKKGSRLNRFNVGPRRQYGYASSLLSVAAYWSHYTSFQADLSGNGNWTTRQQHRGSDSFPSPLELHFIESTAARR